MSFPVCGHCGAEISINGPRCKHQPQVNHPPQPFKLTDQDLQRLLPLVGVSA
jgi:hypothetical protein